MSNVIMAAETEDDRAACLTRPNFCVKERVVTSAGGSVRNTTVLQRVNEAKALDWIKARQREFERSGHNREFDYYWGSSSKTTGCAPEFAHRWWIEWAP